MSQHDERRGFKRAQWLFRAVLSHFPNGFDDTNTTYGLYTHTCSHTRTHKGGYTLAMMGAVLWMTGLVLGQQVHLHIFTFLKASAQLSTYPLQNIVCWLCVHAHPTGECVCHWVLLQEREGEACLFQGTPPELMFHTCAQRGTLYRASQVLCINCRRNHFIGGGVQRMGGGWMRRQWRRWGCGGPPPPPGMHSITQYSHLNCFQHWGLEGFKASAWMTSEEEHHPILKWLFFKVSLA